MKKPIVYMLSALMLLGCLAGCMRTDSNRPEATATPAATARPTQQPTHTPGTNDGSVNDTDGFIDDNDGNSVTPDRGDDRMDDLLPSVTDAPAARTPAPDGTVPNATPGLSGTTPNATATPGNGKR